MMLTIEADVGTAFPHRELVTHTHTLPDLVQTCVCGLQ